MDADPATTESKVDELWTLKGLKSGTDLVITDTSIDAGAGISQTITEGASDTTVSRNP